MIGLSEKRSSEDDIKLKVFLEIDLSVTQIIEQVIDKYLEELGCKENLMSVPRDPGLEGEV